MIYFLKVVFFYTYLGVKSREKNNSMVGIEIYIKVKRALKAVALEWM